MMSSQSCMVPSWNLRNQKQLQQEKPVEEVQQVANTTQVNPQPHYHRHHLHQHQNPSPTPVPKPNYEVAELTWENGQLAMHGLGGVLPPTATAQPSKPTWGRIGDTLESFVLQATCQNQLSVPKQNDNPNAGNMTSMVASSSNKWGDSSGHVQVTPSFLKKRVRSSAISIDSGRNVNCSVQKERNHPEMSACASVSATISKDNDTTMMTWPSFDSPNWSFKSKATDDDDVSENQEEECKNKGETTRSHSARPSRAAAVHNQSERRRRDRINQKMKALQKLVPNASKTDKASMLDEVIEYLKNLQAQVQIMNSVRTTMPATTTQMMMPSTAALQQMQQQQHIQMSMLAARMGMGMGMGMGSVGLGMGIGMGIMPHSLSPSTSHSFVPPQFVMPQMIQNHSASQGRNGAHAPNTSVPFADPYSAFLAQSMNMDMYNKMATLYRQSQASQTMASPSGSKEES